MNRTKLIWIFVFLILIAAQIIPYVEGYGITPAKIEGLIEPENPRLYAFKIINKDSLDLRLGLESMGDLKDYIVFENKEIVVSKDEKTKEVSFVINIPEKEFMGKLESSILLKDLSDAGDDGVYAKTGLILKIINYAPGEGKLIDFKKPLVDFMNGQEYITIPYQSMSKEDIAPIESFVEIWNSKKSIQKLSKVHNTIVGLEQKKIVINWTPEIFGKYEAKLLINYGEEKYETSFDIDVGTPIIDIIETKLTNSGGIYRIKYAVRNNWNEELSGATVKLVANENGNKIDEKITELKTLKEYEKFGSDFYYESEKNLSFDLITNVRGNEFVIKDVKSMKAKKGGSNNIVLYVVVCFAIAIIVTIFMYLYLFRKKKKIIITKINTKEEIIKKSKDITKEKEEITAERKEIIKEDKDITKEKEEIIREKKEEPKQTETQIQQKQDKQTATNTQTQTQSLREKEKKMPTTTNTPSQNQQKQEQKPPLPPIN